MKISILGYSGSGKSTFAAKLGKHYYCEVLYLDTVHWLPDWRERDREDEKRIIGNFLSEHPSWVLDGNYRHSLQERRLEESDHIYIFQFNRFRCLYRVLRRYFKYWGLSRESMTEGCQEKIDFEFVCWILFEGRNKKHRQHYREVQRKYGCKVTVIRNPGELKRLERTLFGSGF